MKYAIQLAVVLSTVITSAAFAGVGLAVVTRDASVAGKLVKDAQPVQVYATPKAGDLVRVAPSEAEIWTTGVWKPWPLSAPDKYETCRNETPEESWNNATCTSWDVALAEIVNTTGTVALTWQKTTSNCTDSQPAVISFYRVYSGVDQAALTLLKQVDGNTTAASFPGYLNGVYYFELRAVNSAGVESSDCGKTIIRVRVSLSSVPKPPTLLRVTEVGAWSVVPDYQTFGPMKLAFNVGTVPLTTACIGKQRIVGTDYYGVPKTSVKFKAGMSASYVVAKCG